MGQNSFNREDSNPLGMKVNGRLIDKLKPIKAIMDGDPVGIVKKEKEKFKSGETQEEKAVSSTTDPTTDTEIIC